MLACIATAFADALVAVQPYLLLYWQFSKLSPLFGSTLFCCTCLCGCMVMHAASMSVLSSGWAVTGQGSTLDQVVSLEGAILDFQAFPAT